MSSDSSSTSSDLIEGVRQNEPPAWRRLVRVYSPLVYYWCRRGAQLSPEDSADVLQGVFLAVARRVGEFQKEEGRGSFRGWLRVITSNKIRDHLRRESRQPKATGGSEAAGRFTQVPAVSADVPESLVEASDEETACERSILLNRLLEDLRPRFDERSWKAFWQAEIDGRPRREIAEELAMSVGAVNQAIYRIRKRLREELDGLPEEPM